MAHSKRPLRRLSMVCWSLAFLAGCTASTATNTSQPTVTQATTTTSLVAVFPAFHDYRAGYVDPDGRLHAVTLDGQQDITGPRVPLAQKGLRASQEGTSPDGRYFAFNDAPSSYALMDCHANVTPDQVDSFITTDGALLTSDVYWSPDALHIAATDDSKQGYLPTLLTIADGMQYTIPNGQPGSVLGWADNTHIIVDAGDQTTRSLVSVDMLTGQRQTRYTFPSADAGIGNESVSPDGRYALFITTATSLVIRSLRGWR